jgi:UDP-N-acetylglucosamine--N-acetylmuramyl-(pentapeptide) pyrophosphoryl-undecaprenol N-acetylglucosamine transferase
MSGAFVISGGGTGGHVTPALALGEALREHGERVLFVGGERGIEKRLVPEAGFELATLDARPLLGRGPLARAAALLALARAALAARSLLKAHGARLVIAVGGYASAPAALAAVLSRTPMVLVNTDAVPGLANRLLARFARRIFVGWPGAAEAFGDGARVEVTGVPLRAALRRAFAIESEGEKPQCKGPELEADLEAASRAASRRRAEPREDERLHLFAFGGSQGARQINDALLAAIPALDPARVSVVHQTGESDRARVEAAWRAAGFDALVTAFERDMPSRYRWADLVVCRAGAISVAELALAGRASLLLPLAHVGGGEQFANARELERAGAARVLDSKSLSQATFTRELVALLEEPSLLRTMGSHAARLGRPDAAEAIAAACRRLVEGGA